ncbi:MAG TPA: ABC transporter permease [Acidimicrobiales bacterium]|nr:ABC transporter permease [Acidimicrobiales bacterium]
MATEPTGADHEDPALRSPAAAVAVYEEPASEDAQPTAGVGHYALALRRLRRNRVALAFGLIFLLVVAVSAAAPLYSRYIAHTGPNDNHITDTVRVGGHVEDVVSPEGIPIGPTWHSRFFFGADPNGRDVAVRLLYGGRASLEIGLLAAGITIVLATVVGTAAGYFRGAVDGVLARVMDIIWAFPPLLLGIALGTALALGGLKAGPLTIRGNSLLIPALVIGFVYVPWVGKPIRGQVLSLREREFIDAARTMGSGNVRLMASEIFPNLGSTIVVFVPLIIANAILLEAALSFLGAGVRPPNPSWGTMIGDGLPLLTSSPHLLLVPGLTLVLALVGINVFGDGVRDALDPRAPTRLQR